MNLQKNRVLVTGASGFTGGALVRQLSKLGYRVRALVRKNSNVSMIEDSNVELFYGDLTDSESIINAGKDIDVIYHIAAVYRTAGHANEFYHATNVHGVENIIESARKNDVSRVVHCSTIGVHGDIEDIPANENSPFNPGDIYQHTKLKGELLFSKAMADGLEGVIFRPGAIYGPGDTRLLKMFKQIQRRFFPLFGGGENYYHLSYIDDLVAGIILCGEHANAVGETFILCSDEYTTLKQLSWIIADQLEVKRPRLELPIAPLMIAAKACEAICKPFALNPPLHQRRVEFFVKSRAFSNAKAKQLLGFNPQISTREGVRRTIAWYRENALL